MLGQIKILTKLELVNLFGFNVLRHIRDEKEKKKKTALAAVIGVVVLMAAFYAGGYAYGLIWMGMSDIVVMYLTAVSSMIILFLGFLKAGSVLFNRNGYDIISSLPVSRTAVVASRFLRMYVEGLLLTAVVMLPGMAVYGILVGPAPAFYLLGVAGMFFVPLIPLSIAVFIGALITGIASRMRYKSIAEAVLSVALVAVVMVFSVNMGNPDGELDPEMLRELGETLRTMLGKIYPPSVWLGTAVTESALAEWLLFAGVSIVFFAATVTIVSFSFDAICRRLFANSAKHNYQMRALEQDSLLVSLCRRELKRYFASGIYVTNTIIGPVMGVIAAVALFVVGVPALMSQLPFAVDLYSVAPVVIAMMFCMMNPTCVSVSMEGKNWWIAKSLPLDTKSILDAKIMAALVVALPFYLVAEVFLFLALKPGFWSAIWIIFVPMLCILFCSVFGIAVNLRMPLMKWESEVQAVKQSASAAVGGLGGALLPLIFAVAVAAVPQDYSLICKLAVCIILPGVTVFLYIRNNGADLQGIE